MKKFFLPYLAAMMCLLSQPVFSQDDKDTTSLLGLPGDNLDLYAVLTIFQKAKTIEAFEKTLNDEKTGINNLDLDLDKKVDFIKVVTSKDSKDSNAFAFTLKVDVSKTETQDVAVILVSKDKKDVVSIQMVGDEDLYGKDYVIEPKGNSSVTANPGYTGENPVTVNVPASTTVVVQSAPIVQYVYSPAYVPYVPPYYYGYPPPWFGFATVMAVGIYRSNHYGYHGGYYGGHYGGSYHGGNNNVIINNGNRNNINHHNNTRNTSNTVANNKAGNKYGTGSANRPSAGTSNRPSAGTSNRPSAGTSNRPSAGTSNRPSAGTSNRPSTSNYSSSGRTRSGGGGYSGGGFSGGGGSRGGGGGGRRR